MALQRLAPKKSFSQNFLNDQNMARKIVRALNPSPGDSVIEIGPGTGSLTQLLLQEDISLTAVELDTRAIEILKKEFPQEKFPAFSIYEGDIRKFPLREFAETERAKGRKVKIIGNIPYSITSDILFWVYENAAWLDLVVLMMQKEVAYRLISAQKSKEYGILAVSAALAGKTIIEFHVPPGCFFPRPQVTSAVISFRPAAKQLQPEQYASVRELIRAAFNQRRKKLSNALSHYIGSRTSIPLQEIVGQAEEKGIGYFSQRAEELSPRDFLLFEQFLRNFF